MKSTHTRLVLRITLPMIVSFPLTPYCLRAAELPVGGTVVSGAASIQNMKPGRLTVRQDSQRAVLRWESFNTSAGASVQFVQPNASASTLNVVTGNSASVLAGSLQANGSVVLINQNGVTITPTGLVDTRAGFIASSLGINEGDFMAGNLRFAGKGGAVVNSGTIQTGDGGFVGLLGSTVSNSGLIRAPLGQVALAAGGAATLDLHGDGFLQVLLPVDAGVTAVADNSGKIVADGGSVVLKASALRDAVRSVVNMPGTIQARSVSGSNGNIVLGADAVHVGGSIDVGGTGQGALRIAGNDSVQVTGTLAADGAVNGGQIDVSAAAVSLKGASISATGLVRGGVVRVGGAYQGGRAQDSGNANAAFFSDRFGVLGSIANANTTVIDAASKIDVSASGVNGTGGTAIVWSERHTDLSGVIKATGVLQGGAVEVSSKGMVSGVVGSTVALGKGGTLLLDPADIQIDDSGTDPLANESYATHPGMLTHLKSSDITHMLSTGANVQLQASDDIYWTDNFSFISGSAQQPAGNLSLSAGRSVSLSGTFNTGGGNWSLVANDRAANGVVDADRQAGPAIIDVSSATFIAPQGNANGALSMLMSDGAGNTNRTAGGIYLRSYDGAALTATILPTVTYGNGDLIPAINLIGDTRIAGPITLTGNIRSGMESGGYRVLSGSSVTWTNEKTGATLSGSGGIEFIENNVVTRVGILGFSSDDATRLALGDAAPALSSRVYGDADPTFASLGTPQIHVTPYSAYDASDNLADILGAGSVNVVGPGAHAPVGARSLSIQATSNVGFTNGLQGSYFLDLSAAAAPLTITPRPLAYTVNSASYTYGAPSPVVRLNALSGDALTPLTTLNGIANTPLQANGAGFGFAPHTPAGASAFTLTGLTGADAGNYTFVVGSGASGTLAIAPKTLTYSIGNGASVYGDTVMAPALSLNGVVGVDDVSGNVALQSGSASYGLGARVPAGSYSTRVASLGGTAAGNYLIDGANSVNGTYTVAQKIVTTHAASGTSVYGTVANVTGSQIDGVLLGDEVTGVVGLSNYSSLTARTSAGTHETTVVGFGGADGANYAVEQATSTTGILTVLPKSIGYAGSGAQVYGSPNIDTSISFNGVVAGDMVSAATRNVTAVNAGQAGASGALAVGSYRVEATSLTGADSANYVVAPGASALVNVTQRPVTYTQTGNGQAVYGTLAATPAPQLFGIVAGDLINAVPGIGHLGNAIVAIDPLTATTAAGNYALGVRDLSGQGAGNYLLQSSSIGTYGSLLISPKPITWTVTDSSGNYGALVNTPVTLNGKVAGDDVDGALNLTGGPHQLLDVGRYGVQVTGLTGTAAANYTLSSIGDRPGVYTVTPAPLPYTINGNIATTYGTYATPSASVAPTFSGESLGAIQFGYATPNGPVALSARSPAGSYALEILSFGNPNYSPNTAGSILGQVTIAPKPLILDAPNVSSVYGTAAVLAPFAMYGLLSGDDVVPGATVLASTGQAPLARQAAGMYTLAPETGTQPAGRDAANYSVSYNTSFLNIMPRPIHYTVDAVIWNGKALGSSVTYGDIGTILSSGMLSTGFEAAAGNGAKATLTGVLGGDDVKLNVASNPWTTSTSGSYTVGTMTFSGNPAAGTGSVLTGGAAGNYVVAATGNVDRTLTITPKVIEVFGVGVAADGTVGAGVYGSAKSAVSQITGRVNTNIGTDQIYSSAHIAGGGPNDGVSNVGAYPVQVDTFVGNDAANYSALWRDGVYNVLPRPVWVTATNMYANYGTVPQASLNNLVYGDAVSAALALCSGAGCATTTPLPDRVQAGQYAVHESALTGAGAGNYVLVNDPAGSSASARSLTVAKLPVTLTGGFNSLNEIYGDPITANGITYSGVLAGDQIGLYLLTQPLIMTTFVPFTDATGKVRDVGTYVYNVAANGRDAGNYTFAMDGALRTLQITPRTVTPMVQGSNVTYSTGAAPAVTFGNAVPGDNLTFTFDTHTTAGVTIDAVHADVGTYVAGVTGLTGKSAQNYTLAPGSTGAWTVQPKAITFSAAAVTGTYGTAATVGVLNGVLFDDIVSLSGVVDGAATMFATGANAALAIRSQIDAGTHSWRVDPAAPLGGPKGGNYRLSGTAVTGSVNIDPKTINYTVDNARGQYGNYRACDHDCDPWVTGIELGKARLTGVLAGDTLDGTVGLLDLNGRSGVVDATTPVGFYYEVVTGLTGRSAANYRLAPTGSAPGILQIGPLWVVANPSNGVYLAGFGLVGTIGTATFGGPTGTGLLNGDTATAVVGLFDSEFYPIKAATRQGRYYFQATSLTGKDAGNYRIIPYSDELKLQGTSQRGTLDVYGGTDFGLTLVSLKQLPLVRSIAPADPAPAEAAPVPMFSEFGRDITVNQTGTSSVTGSLADPDELASTTARSQGVAESNTGLGNANVSGQASGAAEALAKVGVSGVSAEVNASGHLDITVTIGAGKVSAGLASNAGAKVGIDSGGLEISAAAIVSANVNGGVSGNLGAGHGAASGTASVFAYADTSVKFEVKNGKLNIGTEQTAGVGASVSAAGTYGSNFGSVDVGMKVATPGSVGVGAGATAGISGETLTIGLNLGLALGIGGFSFNVSTSVNLKDTVKPVLDFFSGSLFSQPARDTSLDGMSAPQRQSKMAEREMAVANSITNAAQLYQYLTASGSDLLAPEQADAYHTADFKSDRQFYVKFVAEYQLMQEKLDAAIAEQTKFQATMIRLLSTDPAAAVAYSHVWYAYMQRIADELTKQEKLVSVTKAVVNNKLVYKVAK